MLRSRQLPEVNSGHVSGKPAEKVCVTVLLCAYLPGYKAGGPIRSIANMMAALGSEVQFRIATLDRDLGETSPYPGVITNQWVRSSHADVMYLRPGLGGFLRLWALLRSVDQDTVLYLNSFFGRQFSMVAVLMCWLRLCRPNRLVLAPRGEFSPGAMGIKHARKRLYMGVSRWFGIHQSVIWHASSDFEAADIQSQFPMSQKIHVAAVIPGSDGKRQITPVTLPSDHSGPQGTLGQRRRKVAGRLSIVFVGRCSRKKNLSGALTLLTDVTGDVSLDIYGPTEDIEYWGECQRIISTLPANILVRYQGAIEHSRVSQVFTEHDLFLFPTLGENYGHVICEALASGCPILISDQTPWRNLEEEGVGWDIPLGDTERFRAALQQCVDGDEAWFAALSMRALNYAVNRASDPEIISANRRLFSSCG